MLGVAGSLAYGVTALACGFAAAASHPHVRLRAGRWFWAGCGLFFCLLAASRLSGLEDLIRNGARGMLKRSGHYADRWDWQAPAMAAALLVLAIMAIPVVRWQIRDVRQVLSRQAAWARLGVLAMVGLIALRLISLHSTDRLLYGPLHLNWLVDIGATLAVGVSAARFARQSRRVRPRG